MARKWCRSMAAGGGEPQVESRRGSGKKNHSSGSSGVSAAVTQHRNMKAISASSRRLILSKPNGAVDVASIMGARCRTAALRADTPPSMTSMYSHGSTSTVLPRVQWGGARRIPARDIIEYVAAPRAQSQHLFYGGRTSIPLVQGMHSRPRQFRVPLLHGAWSVDIDEVVQQSR